ncbi:MAG: Na/Pi cotransporter family protein [Deferrisomatales bacterium]
MLQEMAFGAVGGLGLFLFGMRIMSEGLQRSAGARLRRLLQLLTQNRFVALLVGLVVTTVVQSSSATTVMVVSFVNAGLMSLTQAVGVVLGANIGTTVTAQLIAFKIQHYALPAIGVGMGLKLFGRRENWQNLGEILLGFGLLFFGMTVMREAFGPLRSDPMFQGLFVRFGANPLLAIVVGAVFTMIVQSSTATVGIVMALAGTGLLDFPACVAIILGDNIGTTVTANLAAVGTNAAAKRTARAHTIFNLCGVAWILLILPAFMSFVNSITPGDPDFVIRTAEEAARYGAPIGEKPYIARHIANAHTLFNVVNCLVFLPLLGLLTRAATWLVPDRGGAIELAFHLKYLNPRVLDTPDIALGQARLEVTRMAELSEAMLRRSWEYLKTGEEASFQRVVQKEQLVDLLQKEITDFLTTLSGKSITSEASKEVADMLHMVADLERVGDHAENLARLAQRVHKNKIEFSEDAQKGIAEIFTVAQDFLAFATGSMMERHASILPRAREFEERINHLEDSLREGHIRRLQEGACQVEPGLVYIDMLTNLEKIGDHAYNVAEFLAGAR